MPKTWPTTRDALESEVICTFYRSGGPGGQHRNKVETGVRLFHPPSGVRVSATERRSQLQNKELAWERLIAKLKIKNHRPKKRNATKKPHSAERKRLDKKKHRGQLKRDRKNLDT